MRVSLTIYSSTLQFLLTDLKEEKYPGIEALNLFIRGSLRNMFYKQQKKHALRHFSK